MYIAAGSSARVLVAVASKMGSTAEIAEAVAARLRAGSHEATVVPVGKAPSPEAFDAVVVGSAVYIRGWEKAALRYLTRHQDALRVRPTYLFESGPSGDRSESDHHTSARVLRLAEKIGCRPPTVFGGNVDPKRAIGRVAKWVASSDMAGDYRDWDMINTWADEIAGDLSRGARPPDAEHYRGFPPPESLRFDRGVHAAVRHGFGEGFLKLARFYQQFVVYAAVAIPRSLKSARMPVRRVS